MMLNLEKILPNKETYFQTYQLANQRYPLSCVGRGEALVKATASHKE
jgi:hypothetical protein